MERSQLRAEGRRPAPTVASGPGPGTSLASRHSRTRCAEAVDHGYDPPLVDQLRTAQPPARPPVRRHRARPAPATTGRSSSTPPSCCPTRGRCCASPSTRSCCRSSSSPSSRASATTPSWATSPARRCGCSTTCGSARPPRRPAPARRRRRHPAGRAQPHRPARRCRPASGWATTTPASSPSPRTSPPRAATSRWCPRTCRCGSRRRRSACDAEEYRAELAVDSGWTGMAELDVTVERDGPRSTSTGRVEHRRRPPSCPCHTGLVLLSAAGQRPGPGRRRQAGPPGPRRPRRVRPARPQRRAADRPRPAARPRRRHRLASAAAPAPASPRSPCAPGSRRCMERRQHRKVIVFRPLYAVGGQELGYLPGSEAEKMSPWAPGGLRHPRRAGLAARWSRRSWTAGMLEVLPLTHIRGRSLHDAFVIVDEAQSLERNVLLTVLSPDRPELAGRAHPRRRPARQPAGRPARRRRRGHRGAQGPPAVRPRHADPLRAQPDRGPGHRAAGGPRPVAGPTASGAGGNGRIPDRFRPPPHPRTAATRFGWHPSGLARWNRKVSVR